MSNNIIKWGILAPGKIAHQFAQDFAHIENGKLVAVASRSEARAKEFALQYHIERAYGSYQALYEDAEVDAIYVATPHNFHFENSKDALMSGKAVMCEKPITVNPEELQDLLKIAQVQAGYLMEALWTYFLPAIINAQSWVAAGRLGKILQVKADFGYPAAFDAHSRMYNPDLAGGALLDMGIYPIAMAALFIESMPKDLKVVVNKAKTGVDDEVTMLLEYQDSLANLCTSFRAKLNNWAYIIGDNGYIAIPDFWRAKECFLYEGDQLKDHFKDSSTAIGYHYEVISMNEDLFMGRKASHVVPHAMSMKLQKLMALVATKF